MSREGTRDAIGAQHDVNPPAAEADKAAWRAWAKRNRARGAGVGSEARDAAIVANVRAWELFQRAQHVLLYLPIGGEVDLTTLTGDATRTYYVTRTWPGSERILSVHAYDPAALEQHAYGFAQPRATAAEIDPSLIDFALVPGLAFDAAGTRLGYGRGYFDRLLARLAGTTPRVGVTPLAAVVPRLPREPHDVAMDYLATEMGIRAVIHGRSRADPPHGPNGPRVA